MSRYFDGYSEGLYMRRYFCPECNRVHTLRPLCYERRISASVCLLFLSLAIKLRGGRWLDEMSRQRQQHWMRSFYRHVMREGLSADPLECLQRWQAAGLYLASWSLIYREKFRPSDRPYRSFAVTASLMPP